MDPKGGQRVSHLLDKLLLLLPQVRNVQVICGRAAHVSRQRG